MGNTLCNTDDSETLDFNPNMQKIASKQKNKESISSLGKTTMSTKSQFSLFNRLKKVDQDEKKQMLEAKWTQFRNTSNIFDEVDNSSNESTSSQDNGNEPKIELSKTAE